MHSALSSAGGAAAPASIVTLARSPTEDDDGAAAAANTITFTDGEGNVITSVMGDGSTLNLNGVTVVTSDQLGSFLSPVTLDANGSISLKLENKLEVVDPATIQAPFEVTVKKTARENEKKICLWPTGSGTTCGKAFAKFDSLKRHLTEAHKGVRPYACKLCDKTYGRRDYLQRHLKSHNASYAVNLTGSNAANLSAFANKVTPPKASIDGKGASGGGGGGSNSMTSIPFLHLYSMQHQTMPKPLGSKICRWVQDDGTVCGKAFSKLDSLRRHVNELHKGVRPFACTMCDKNYGRKDYLDRHLKTHDPSVQKKRPLVPSSGLVEWGANMVSLLNSIKEEEEGPKPHRLVKKKRKDIPAEEKKICLWVLEDGTACGKTFTKFDSLKRHVSEGHKNVRPFTCTLCGKTYGRRDYLLRHLRSHNEADLASLAAGVVVGPKPVSDGNQIGSQLIASTGATILSSSTQSGAIQSGDGTVPSSELTVDGHIVGKKRANDKKTCRWVLDNGTICGRSFSKFDSLRRHVQELHKGVRPFICQLCQKSYGRKDYLERHLRSHEESVTIIAEPTTIVRTIGRNDPLVAGTSEGINAVLSSEHGAVILSEGSELGDVNVGVVVGDDDDNVGTSSDLNGTVVTVVGAVDEDDDDLAV